jgi:hypothetical protein
MSLHNGIDTVSYLTVGQYTKTYSSAVGQASMNVLFSSLGFLESASAAVVATLRGYIRMGLNLILY